MKKLISLFLCLVLMLGVLAGCGKTPAADDNKDTDGKKLSIVATIFPAYDWVRQILGERASDVDLTLLLDSGADLHSYQPTADDMVKISNCDMFVYVGGESDEWVKDALANATNKNMVAVNLMDVLGDSVKEEEIVEGMEHDHDHDHEESEAHSKEVSTFEDDQVQDRSLKDWAGEWQSAYPYVLDGSLDKGFAHKAESGKMTAEEYKAYYATGYETELKTIAINGDTNTITFTDVNGKTCASPYKYVGYYIQDWSTGTRAAMYRFEAVNKASGAPAFIEFNDHIIEPCQAEHFHFRSSNTGFDDIEDPENRWPTFFPADWNAEDILEAFIGHDHSDDDDHHHEDGEVEYDEHEQIDNITNDILLGAEKLFAERGQIMDKDQALWAKLWDNANDEQKKLDDYSAIIKASTALTNAEKDVLLRSQARLDVLNADIGGFYEKAAEATAELTAQRDQAIAELQELYAKSAHIWAKVYGE